MIAFFKQYIFPYFRIYFTILYAICLLWNSYIPIILLTLFYLLFYFFAPKEQSDHKDTSEIPSLKDELFSCSEESNVNLEDSHKIVFVPAT